MALGAADQACSVARVSDAGSVQWLLPVLPKAELAMELAPALLGVGFILGYRQSGVLVSGSHRLGDRPDAADRVGGHIADRAALSGNRRSSSPR